ncbi:hypothetical protein ACU686_30940 [Yinghuangia aomiensis]
MDTTQPLPAHRRSLERYTVVGRLARGGSADLWRAHDGDLDREVVVKVPTSHEPSDRAALAHEARMTRKARGDGVPVVPRHRRPRAGPRLHHGPHRGREHRAATSEGTVEPPDRAALFGIGIAKALQNVHFADVVHRDIKPENLVVRPDGRDRHHRLRQRGDPGSALGPGPVRHRDCRLYRARAPHRRQRRGHVPVGPLRGGRHHARHARTGERTFPPTEPRRATVIRQIDGDVRPWPRSAPTCPGR